MSTVNIALDNSYSNLILEVDYDFEPGYPATGPSYASGGEPGYGPSVSVNSVTLVEYADGDLPTPGPEECKAIGKTTWARFPREIDRLALEAACEHEARYADDDNDARYQAYRDRD